MSTQSKNSASWISVVLMVVGALMIIEKHALESTGGLTYAELDRENPLRAVAMNGSFLRASLFTSVVAFGVSALVVGVGLMFILLGITLRSMAKREMPMPASV